ncbi:hypothetical protein GCM10009733_008170 [Nonomuraea maheshkhaliensis]|uniref:Transposase n=1 Tax=Nonomuraea maheshkhaliensis TaxID=419590 RepID=A0ABN2EQ36_9ACTN
MTFATVDTRTSGDHADDEQARTLWGLIEPRFLALLSWDPNIKIVTFPADHPELGYDICRVTWCERPTRLWHRLCPACYQRWRRSHPLDESKDCLEAFVVSTSRTPARATGTRIEPCAVLGCPRAWKSSTTRLCTAHEYQCYQMLRLPLDQFLLRPETVPLPSFGICQVAACERQREGWGPYCRAHAAKWARLRGSEPDADEDHWRRTTSAIAVNGKVSLRGLSNLVVAQILYGLQERTRAGTATIDHQLRLVCNLVREGELTQLSALPTDGMGRSVRGLRNNMLKFIECVCRRTSERAPARTDENAPFLMR